MSDWITAREAKRRARDADLTEGDLMEWARQGRLKARAKSGTFSDDDDRPLRKFPEEPPSDEIERAVLGPWPDIPKDFWEAIPYKANWGPGTFASRVEYWSEYHQSNDYVNIELYDVTFHLDNLEGLLNGNLPGAITVPPPKERWQQKQVSEQQRAAFKFLETLRTHPSKKASAGPIARYSCYINWAQNNKLKPLGRTTFTKWADRHADGWREKGGRWVFNP